MEIKEFQLGELIIDKYKVNKIIGRGGMNSVIYLAEDITLNPSVYTELKQKFVAIKIINKSPEISDEDWNKFFDECLTSFRITGRKNIVNTYDVRRNDDSVIVVMEFVKGSSLRKIISEQGNINVKEALYYFSKMIDAVKEMHAFEHKIIHRDLKPENIIISDDKMEVKVIDFGISTVNLMKKKQLATQEEQIYGTYPYICPDVFKTARSKTQEEKSESITEQFDFYSLGVILYEMIMGEKPFAADNYDDISVIKLPLQYDIACLNSTDPTIPNAVENIIFKCMASKPGDIKHRYDDVHKIIEDVKHIETNLAAAFSEPLIKPVEKRVLQVQNIFDIEKEKGRVKFYEEKWFFFLLTISGFSILTAALLLYQIFV